MTTLDATLAKLEADLATKDDDYARTRRFHSGEPVTEAEIAAREAELDVRFPPSYREALLRHGRFSFGKRDKTADHLTFKIWDLPAHRTALAEYADQLDCEVTAEAVADEIGMEADVVEALGKVILVGYQGHEDYLGFDLRTLNPKTGECSFGFVLFDDTEIEAFSEKDTSPCEGRGFDAWVAKYIARRQ